MSREFRISVLTALALFYSIDSKETGICPFFPLNPHEPGPTDGGTLKGRKSESLAVTPSRPIPESPSGGPVAAGPESNSLSIMKYHIQPYHMNGLNWTLVPDDPQRDNVVIVTGFMPSWWEREYGITFRKDFHTKPKTHQATLAKMAALLRERFQDVENFFFSPFDYENSYPVERVYGDALIPAMFDVEVSFDEASGHPYTDCVNLSDEQALRLAVPDVERHSVLRSIFEGRSDTRVPVAGELGFEGVINIAYQLRGQNMFGDLLEKPDLIDHVFEVVYGTIHNTVQAARNWQDPAGKKPTCFVTCDCMINMISPKMYREHLLEFDKGLHTSFDFFGIHTCNWTVDPYLEAIAEIGEIGYLDMGAETDLEKVHQLFPELTPTVFFHPEKLRNLTPARVKREIAELGRRIGRGYILLCDLETGTTDGQIKAAYEAASAL